MFKYYNKQAAFTLLELLVVLVIISMIAGIVGPHVIKRLDESKNKAAKVQIEELMTALNNYKSDVGQYPSTKQGLKALLFPQPNVKEWAGPYLRKTEIPLDPWQHQYLYIFPGKHGTFDLYSTGADGVEGGEGEDRDIVGWE